MWGTPYRRGHFVAIVERARWGVAKSCLFGVRPVLVRHFSEAYARYARAAARRSGAEQARFVPKMGLDSRAGIDRMRHIFCVKTSCGQWTP